MRDISKEVKKKKKPKWEETDEDEDSDNSNYQDAVEKPTRKPYGFMQSSFWVIMMVHVMVCGDL